MGCLFGEASDIAVTDDLVLQMFPDDEILSRWIKLAREKFNSRVCLRASAGWDMASARTSASDQRSGEKAKSRRRSRLGEIIWITVPWLRRFVRLKR